MTEENERNDAARQKLTEEAEERWRGYPDYGWIKVEGEGCWYEDAERQLYWREGLAGPGSPTLGDSPAAGPGSPTPGAWE